jgi:diacylglycerol O-acyltransferase
MTEVRALSALDLAFFVLEKRERLSNVGPLAILKPPAGTRDSKRFADGLLRRMQKRPVGAPFLYRYRAAGDQGLPRLEAVDGIDVGGHCHRLTLPAPGTNAQLYAFVCRLHEKRLDRSRPLWEFYVIDGLERGRIALYAKVHHGIIDGRGFVDVCTRWLSRDPTDKVARALWEGLPPHEGHAVAHPHADAVTSLVRKAADAGMVAVSLYASLARQAKASAGITSGMPLPFIGTPATLRARPSVRRTFGCCVLPLAKVKALGKANGASVNDVLLTVVDMALHRYLASRRGRTDEAPLVADMPVALPPAGHGGNAIAVLQFPLGAASADPMERLRTICRRTAEVKQHVKDGSPGALVTYTAGVHGIPALFELLGIDRAPMLANLVISNPFGLPERRFLAGAEVETALPISLLAPGQSLNVTAVTYGEGLQIAFLGMAAVLPDVQRLADLTVKAFADLTAAAAGAGRRGDGRVRHPARPKRARTA